MVLDRAVIEMPRDNTDPSCWLVIMEELCTVLGLLSCDGYLFDECPKNSCTLCKYHILYKSGRLGKITHKKKV